MKVETEIKEKVNRVIENRKKTNKKSSSSLESNKEILTIINSKIGSELSLPDSALQLTDHSPEEMLNIALENKWMSQEDIELTNTFNSEMQSEGFETAIKNYNPLFWA